MPYYTELSVDQQPNGGSTYPFLASEEELATWIGDFALRYTDGECQYEFPFQLAWVYHNDGAGVAAPGGWPAPTHAWDVVVKDANGLTVFDSTLADADDFQLATWNTHWTIIQWRVEDQIAKLVSYNDGRGAIDQYVVATNGWLSNRTLTRQAPRLNRVWVGDTEIEATEIEFAGGYNLTVQGQGPVANPGRRRVHQVLFAAAPGLGDGRYPTCEDETDIIRRVNSIGPREDGQFFVATDSCFRVIQPHLITGLDPRTASLTAATMQLRNDCLPCCTCADFVNVYRAETRLWDRIQSVYDQLIDARDLHQTNIDRWRAQKHCRERDPLRLSVTSICPCELAVGVSLCNTSEECITDLELRITLQTLKYGAILSPVTVPVGQVLCNSATRAISGQYERYVVAGEWPVFSGYFDSLPSGQSALLMFRLLFLECQDNHSAKVTATAHTAVDLPGTVTVPGDVEALWASRLPEAPARAMGVATRPLEPAVGDVCKCD